ncbi:MAG: HD domain-containing phosphohydrolase [Betaproteobacteria bacterium]
MDQTSVAPPLVIETNWDGPNASARLRTALERVNKELWLVLSLFVIALILNVVAAQRMVLGFYTLPTVLSAYLYGRRHATLTALLSVLMVALLLYLQNPLFAHTSGAAQFWNKWLDFTVWGGTLIVTGYVVGTLTEIKDRQVQELRETYHGILLILRHFVSKDKYTENHSYRVSVYAAKIGAALELNADRIEDVRAASLLHDIGKLEISRSILYKAARLTAEEFREMQSHVARGVGILEPVGGSLRRILPIILAHHDKFDGSGYNPTHGENIPLEARIISVADVYDSLTSDRPYRQAMSPYDAKEIIVKGSGTEFDPKVVDAFVAAFRAGQMEVPAVVI